jgi:hypothetical protein
MLSKIYKELNMNCEQFLNKEPLMKVNKKSENISSDKEAAINQSFLQSESKNNILATETVGKANSFLMNSFKMYKNNLMKLYDIYNDNEDYKGFITAMDKTLREKAKSKDGKNSKNFRFEQSDPQSGSVSYDSFFNPEKRKEMSDKFVNSISSEKLRNEIKTQSKVFQESDVKGIYSREQAFFKGENQLAQKDTKAVELSTKLYGSITSFADKYKNEKPTGLVTVDGQIANDPVSYIKSEENRLKNNYKDGSSYGLDDIKKLMKLGDLGNDIKISAK